MTPGQRRALAIATCAWFGSSHARADPGAGDAPGDASMRAEAAERFDRGLRFFEEGNDTAALAEFQTVEKLVPNPVVELNIGLVLAALGRAVAAVDQLTLLLEPNSGLNDAQRERARAAASEQRARIGQLAVTVSLNGATLAIDDVAVGQAPFRSPIRVLAGVHVVSASAEGFVSARREVLVPSAVTVPVELDLRPLAREKPHTVVLRVPSEPTPSDPRGTWGVVSIAGGGVIAGASAIWLFTSYSHKRDAARAQDSARLQRQDMAGICDISGAGDNVQCNDAVVQAEANYDDAKSNVHFIPGYVGLGIGAAAVGVGTWLLLGSGRTTPAHSGGARRAPPLLSLGPRSVDLSFEF